MSNSKQYSWVGGVASVEWEGTVDLPFSYEEYADMHLVYGFCNGNATAAAGEYR